MLRLLVVALLLLAGAPAAAGSVSGSAGAPLILHVKQVEADGTVSREIWCDWTHRRARTVNYGDDGVVVGQSVVSIQGRTLRTELLDYVNKRRRPPSTIELPRSASNITIPGSDYFPDAIRQRIKSRLLGPVGRPTLAGRKTILLQGQLGPMLQRIWVEPVTYLAVQARLTQVGSPIPARTERFSWLPATPANLAKTRLVLPPGFTW
jgi:hypothetical protein